MKNPLKPAILPWITLGLGGIGLALRMWLFAGADEKGLLPTGHPADILLYVLTAITAAVLFLCCLPLHPITKYTRLFPATVLGAAGCGIGAVGLLYAAIAELFSGNGILGTITCVAGVLATAAMVCLALCRYRGTRPTFLFHGLLTLFFMLYAVCRSRLWGAEPELQRFFFQLLACLLLLATAYQHCVLTVRKSNRRWFVLCNQAALFFCCLSLNAEYKLFYLCMAAWLTLDLCSLHIAQRQAPTPEEA